MDNLSNDPPNAGNSIPPPFGANFNPHTNPVDPNNPYQTSSQPPQDPSLPQAPLISEPLNLPNNEPNDIKHDHYSQVAQHKPRDAQGHFVPSEHPTNPNPIPDVQGQAPFNPPPNPVPNGTGLPPIIEINQNTKPTDKKDPPLFGFFLTNPVTYLRAFLSKLLKRQMITLKIPVLALIVIMAGVGGGLGGFGIGFKSGIDYGLGKLFPNFSPIFHRSITAQGIIQKSSKGYYLEANDKNKTMWTLNPASSNVKLADYINLKVQIKGNLTPTPNLIDVSEVISFDPNPTPSPASQTSPNLPNSPNLSNPAPSGAGLPKLYPSLTWEVTQSKTLLFTSAPIESGSGKRRIEQEGVYLESSQVTEFPQDFINYYINQLTNLGFKQTLNASEPNGTTITYSKDDLFLTFGVKNIYSGSGDNKKVVGYKAYIEHN